VEGVCSPGYQVIVGQYNSMVAERKAERGAGRR